MKISINKPCIYDITSIECDMGVRYFDNAIINSENDDNENPGMPGIYCYKDGKKRWKIIIDPDTGKVRDWPEGIDASVHYKVCDNCEISFYDHVDTILHYSGYVPGFLQIDDDGWGDYVIISINRNGYIKNWRFNQDYFNECIDEE